MIDKNIKMDILTDVLICRLCSTKLDKDKSVCIFEEDTDLVQKIKVTLSLKVCLCFVY